MVAIDGSGASNVAGGSFCVIKSLKKINDALNGFIREVFTNYCRIMPGITLDDGFLSMGHS